MKRFLVTLSIAILGVLGLTGCNRPLNFDETAYLLGLESGKPYPLILGDKINGTNGSAEIQQGFFSSTATVNLTPGSAITVIFKKDNKEWHLEIPTSKITFIINEVAPPTVVLLLSNAPYYGGGEVQDTCIEHKLSDIDSCNGVSLTNQGNADGLGPIVQQSLQSATFTVSQATADQLSGRK